MLPAQTAPLFLFLATPTFVPSYMYAHIILQDSSAERMDTYSKFFDEGIIEFLMDEGFDADTKRDVPASRSEESDDDLKRLMAKKENPNTKSIPPVEPDKLNEMGGKWK